MDVIELATKQVSSYDQAGGTHTIPLSFAKSKVLSPEEVVCQQGGKFQDAGVCKPVNIEKPKEPQALRVTPEAGGW